MAAQPFLDFGLGDLVTALAQLGGVAEIPQCPQGVNLDRSFSFTAS